MQENWEIKLLAHTHTGVLFTVYESQIDALFVLFTITV